MSSEYGFTFQDTLEYAIVPSFDTAPLDDDENGLAALMTSGSLLMFVVAWLTADLLSATVPCLAWNTICPA